jgi:sorting nexin-1/2
LTSSSFIVEAKTTDSHNHFQLIELWETYLLQLDSDEDGPPLMPAGVVADSAAQSRPTDASGNAPSGLIPDDSEEDGEGEPSISGTTALDSEAASRPSMETAHDDDEDDVETRAEAALRTES